jgi:hypothetical protein
VILGWGTFFSPVWLLWYAVGIEVGGEGLSIFTSETRVRRLADALAIAFGAASLAFAGLIARSVAWAVWLTPVYAMWAPPVVGSYGQDLWASFKASGIATAGKDAVT